MDRLGARVLVLPLGGNRNGDDLCVRLLAEQVDAWVLHGELRASVGVNPLNRCTSMRMGALGDQVIDVV